MNKRTDTSLTCLVPFLYPTVTATKATVVLNIFMMVLSRLNHAVDQCRSDADGTEQLDKAVAYYTGSQQNFISDGHLLYREAEEMSSYFNTRGIDQSLVNQRIFALFRAMQKDLVERDCLGALNKFYQIESQMYIPMIQGVLFHAYEQDILDERETSNPLGAMYAAAVMPYVFAVSVSGPKDYLVLQENMQVGSKEVDFAAVKAVLEKNYPLFNITCADVGGIGGETGYLSGAEPCIDTPAMLGGTTTSTGAGNTISVAVVSTPILALVVGALTFVVAFFVIRFCMSCKRGTTSAEKNDEEMPPEAERDNETEVEDLPAHSHNID